ncbi:MAG: ThuA domain-containing protein [Vicinamibacterales bacterium]
MRSGLVIAATLASVTIGLAQAPPGNPGGGRGGGGSAAQTPAANVPARGSASVRVPAWRQLRTAVANLLGWQVGVSLGSFPRDSFLEAARKAEALDLAVVAGDSTQKVSIQIPKNLDYRLAPGEMDAVRNRMTTLSLRMPVYFTAEISVDEPIARKQFEFAKSLGVETVVVARTPRVFPVIERLADEFGVNVALSGSLKTVLDALQGRGPRIGAYADLGTWMREGVAPLDGVAQLKERLLVLKLGDRSAVGKSAPLLAEIYRRELKPSLMIVDADGGSDVVEGLSRALEAFERAAQPAVAERVMQLSRGIPIKGPDRLTPEERERIIAATPQKPAATPKASRRLLIYDANIGYGGANGGHRSIPAANLAIELFAKTGAYETVFSNDLENFKYDRLKKFDAVFLNNTVGQIFIDPEVRTGLSRFVREGGGLAGYHGTSHASMDWPEFGQMLGAVEGSHREPTEMATVKIDDPASPLVAAFGGKSFVHQDEFYRFVEGPLSRDKVHVLMSMDIENTDLSQGRGCMRPCVRPDADYALSWIHSYGKGRVFFTALGHTPAFFASSNLSDFFFRGIQFVLGDLDADTTPSAKLASTPR